jgi:hypothetical protein
MTTGVAAMFASMISLLSVISKNVLFTAVLITLFGAVLIVTYLWAPQGYSVYDDLVVVKRLIGDTRIANPREVSRWNWTWWGIRLYGSGALFGYYGTFAFKGTGIVRMYATNRKNLVLVTDGDGKKYLLSPDDPERFIEQTQTRLLPRTLP